MMTTPVVSEETVAGNQEENKIAEPDQLTLQECFKLALGRSEELAIKQVDIEKSWAEFLKASGEVLGDVNFVATHFRQDVRAGGGGGDATATATRQTRRERRFEITQPLFQGFRSIGAFQSAGGLKTQREEEKRRAEQVLFRDVVEAFYAALRYEKDLEITRDIIELYNERIEELTQRENIGKSRPSEVVTAESRLRITEADLAGLEGGWASERRILEFLIGLSLEAGQLRDDEDMTETPTALDTYIPFADRRPDVEAARQAARVALGGLIDAQSELWPEITLDSKYYEKREGFQSGIDWDVLFTIDVPLLTGGTSLGETKEAHGTWKQTKLKAMQTHREAQLEIKQAYDAWTSSIKEYEALEKALETAERNYELQRVDYEKNLVNNLDVLEALESLNETRLATNQAFYDLKEDYWRFQVATGVCCESV